LENRYLKIEEKDREGHTHMEDNGLLPQRKWLDLSSASQIRLEMRELLAKRILLGGVSSMLILLLGGGIFVYSMLELQFLLISVL
jgi:hypothetical protein